MKRSHGVPHGTRFRQGRMQPAPADGNTRRKGRYCSTSAKTLMAHEPAFCSRPGQAGDSPPETTAGPHRLGHTDDSPVTATKRRPTRRYAGRRSASGSQWQSAEPRAPTRPSTRRSTLANARRPWARASFRRPLTTSRASPSAASRSCPLWRSECPRAPARSP
jgi:hypothetical protein